MEQDRKPGTFVKGDSRINRKMGPGQQRRAFRVLADLRAVYGQDKSKDRGPTQKTLRKFFEQDPSGFVRRLMDAEHRYAALKAEEREAAPGERVDMSAERAREVILAALKRHREKQAQRNVAQQSE